MIGVGMIEKFTIFVERAITHHTKERFQKSQEGTMKSLMLNKHMNHQICILVQL